MAKVNECDIQGRSVWARKNTHQICKNYQISQFKLLFVQEDKSFWTIVIMLFSWLVFPMEEDAGKLNHDGADSINGA